jgi:hypothetical protein
MMYLLWCLILYQKFYIKVLRCKCHVGLGSGPFNQQGGGAWLRMLKARSCDGDGRAEFSELPAVLPAKEKPAPGEIRGRSRFSNLMGIERANPNVILGKDARTQRRALVVINPQSFPVVSAHAQRCTV